MSKNEVSAPQKKWSQRFEQSLDAQVSRFNASITFDYRLALFDILASKAHVEMLSQQDIISVDSMRTICSGLDCIKEEVAQGTFDWREEDEDVHFNIERRLIEIVGNEGKRLHTARSRNDQVATSLRLYLREQLDKLVTAIVQARYTLLKEADIHADTLMPGMTHLQIAQPITLGHHWLAYEAMLERDMERFEDARRRLNRLPLGAGALSGVSYPIDRHFVAAKLGFDGVCENSIDAVSDRDFTVEFASASSLLMIHLSRLCEELILWNSPAFGFISLSDSFCTGSSIMPQKKNPDVPELIRGKSGRVLGALNALLVLGKSQPLAYNKDNQEDKEPLFDCVDTVYSCVELIPKMIDSITINKERMLSLLEQGYPTATELADYLTRQGISFRDAHGAVSAIVRLAEQRQVRLIDLSLEEMQQFAPEADEGARAVLDVKNAVECRHHIGGTAPVQVRAQSAKKQAELKERFGSEIFTDADK